MHEFIDRQRGRKGGGDPTDVSLFDLFDIFLRTCQHRVLCENSTEGNASILCLSWGGLLSADATHTAHGYASVNKFLLIRDLQQPS